MPSSRSHSHRTSLALSYPPLSRPLSRPRPALLLNPAPEPTRRPIEVGSARGVVEHFCCIGTQKDSQKKCDRRAQNSEAPSLGNVPGSSPTRTAAESAVSRRRRRRGSLLWLGTGRRPGSATWMPPKKGGESGPRESGTPSDCKSDCKSNCKHQSASDRHEPEDQHDRAHDVRRVWSIPLRRT